MNKNILKWSIAILVVFTMITYIGCEQKNDRADQPENAKVTADTTTTAVKSEEPKDTVLEVKVTFPDMLGTWNGTFDGRSSTLKITEQIDSSFAGKITINYRQVTNQEVKGILNPRTGEITMTDQLHSRYQGKYKGVLSTNNNNLSGTFTMDNDGTKYSFNFNKK